MNRWFGPAGPWAQMHEGAPRIPTPVDALCLYCAEPIAADDEGEVQICVREVGVYDERPIHRECSLRMSLGGANHQRGTCSCQGGPDPPDPPGLTRREAARAAVTAWETKRP